MLTYVFKEYLNDKNTRRINTQLSLRSMKNNNPNDFDDKKTEYKNIYDFHSKYVQRKFEQDILNKMTHKDAVEYFISRIMR